MSTLRIPGLLRYPPGTILTVILLNARTPLHHFASPDRSRLLRGGRVITGLDLCPSREDRTDIFPNVPERSIAAFSFISIIFLSVRFFGSFARIVRKWPTLRASIWETIRYGKKESSKKPTGHVDDAVPAKKGIDQSYNMVLFYGQRIRCIGT